MRIKQLPEAVQAEVDNWLGPNTIEYFWEQDGTYFVTTVCAFTLYYLRVFKIGTVWQLSQDHHVHHGAINKW